MKRHFTFLAALALVASFAAGAQAQAPIEVIGSLAKAPTGTPGPAPVINYTNGGVGATLTATQISTHNITAPPEFLVNPMGPTQFNSAEFTLTATSTQASVATLDGAGQLGFNGTFSIMAGSTNILTATFTNARLLVGAGAAFFRANDLQTGSSVTFTSDVYRPGLFAEAFSFDLQSTNPLNPVSGSNISNFSAGAISGNFSAAIPEPATLAMAGLGILALPLAVRATRRRRSGN